MPRLTRKGQQSFVPCTANRLVGREPDVGQKARGFGVWPSSLISLTGDLDLRIFPVSGLHPVYLWPDYQFSAHSLEFAGGPFFS